MSAGEAFAGHVLGIREAQERLTVALGTLEDRCRHAAVTPEAREALDRARRCWADATRELPELAELMAALGGVPRSTPVGLPPGD